MESQPTESTDDLKASCPYCGQHIRFPREATGEWTTCPNDNCGKSFPLPSPPLPAALLKSYTKKRRKRLFVVLLLSLVCSIAVGVTVGLFYQYRDTVAGIAGIGFPMILGLVAFVLFVALVVMWIMFPVFVYQELRRANRTLEKIEANTRGKE